MAYDKGVVEGLVRLKSNFQDVVASKVPGGLTPTFNRLYRDAKTMKGLMDEVYSQFTKTSQGAMILAESVREAHRKLNEEGLFADDQQAGKTFLGCAALYDRQAAQPAIDAIIKAVTALRSSEQIVTEAAIKDSVKWFEDKTSPIYTLAFTEAQSALDAQLIGDMALTEAGRQAFANVIAEVGS